MCRFWGFIFGRGFLRCFLGGGGTWMVEVEEV